MTDQKLPVLLIVEDDEGLQRQLKWAYEGYEVVLAGNRAAAIVARRGSGAKTARYLASRGFAADALEGVVAAED